MERVTEEQEQGTILKKKKTQGRRKIEIRKIEKRSSRQVTFSKRRAGLFKYVNDVCVLTGAQIGVLVKSPGNRVFAYGSPNIDAIIDRFQNKATDPSPERFWWQESVESLELEELQGFVAALEELKNNVSRKISTTDEGFQSVMVTPEFEEAVSTVDGWLNFTGKDRDFSDDCRTGSENLDDSSSGFENVDDSSSGFQKFDDSSSGFQNFDDFSSGFENYVDCPCGFEKVVGSISGFSDFDDFSSGFQDFDFSSYGVEKFDEHGTGFQNFGFGFGQAGSPLLLNY